MKINVNSEKIKNIIDSTSFYQLQKMEEKGLFDENVYGLNKEKIKFFNKGPTNDWKKELDKNIQTEIEKIFYKEMMELGYLK